MSAREFKAGSRDDVIPSAITGMRRVWTGGERPVISVDEFDVECGEDSWSQYVVTAQRGRPGAVVLAVSARGVLLARQYRAAAGEWFWEIPRGFSDENDGSPLHTGLRELLEETGWVTETAEVIGTIFADTGLLSNRIAVVLAEVSRVAEEPDSECDGFSWVPVEEIDELIRTGVIRDGISLSALSLWAARG